MDWYDWVPWGIGVVGFAFGVVGEVRARRAERRLKRAEDVSPWEEMRHLSGDLFAIKNASTRDVVVSAVSADPSSKERLLTHRRSYPAAVSAGDSFEFMLGERLSLSRPDIVISWRFADDDRERTNRRLASGVTTAG